MHDDHHKTGRETAPQRHDGPTIGERLQGLSGPAYWRSLDELADTEEFRELLHREFPQGAEFLDPVSRRSFVKLMGASLALAGVTACTRQPTERIVPYVRQPEEIVPGKPLFFATAMPVPGGAIPLIVESHEGRPTKVEGNPEHPESGGATDAISQASVLDLYDPDRTRTITFRGRIESWGAFLTQLKAAVEANRAAGGGAIRILTGSVTSPTLASQIAALQRELPGLKWHQWEPTGRDQVRAGARLALGEDADVRYNLESAAVIVALDADFLSCGPGSLRYARDFANGRRVTGGRREMNRLYALEATPSATGSVADHRLPVRPSDIPRVAQALAAAVGVPGAAAADVGEMSSWLGPIGRDLLAHRGRSVVIVGDEQPAEVHALGHAINQALGNVGQTVVFTEPVEARPVDGLSSLWELVNDMEAGRVDTLLVIDSNPVYTAPADMRFADRLNRVRLRVHLGLHPDETAALCHWQIPMAHYLESWSDTRAADGTVTIIQPLIAPLHGGRTAHELVAALGPQSGQTGYEILRAYWQGRFGTQGGAAAAGSTGAAPAGRPQPPAPAQGTKPGAGRGGQPGGAPRPPAAPPAATAQGGSTPEAGQGPASPGSAATPAAAAPQGAAASPAGADFERFWRKALHDGMVTGTAARVKTLTPRPPAASAPPAVAKGLDIVFRPDPSIFDGRFANNAWLQELPKPNTKLTWDNAALLSPKTAERLGVRSQDVVELRYRGRRLAAAAWVLPGQAPDTVTLHLGYGRTRAGHVGTGTGFNAYALRTSHALWSSPGLEVSKTGGRHQLVTTQNQQSVEGRNVLRAGTLEQFREHPEFAHEGAEAPRPGMTLYPEHEYPGYAWAMAIDLSTCIGCNACVVACNAENNIPSVGKVEVGRGHRMHWLRVDRYYTGDPERPEAFNQPVPCMHCENAPCEVVCPVAATAHNEEGLNDMVYNRCVGTRYCSNNCPYKVRRFNFFRYTDWEKPTLKMVQNPDVTVRSRGVMEKCTYCVQRINAARIQAERENRRVRDGEVVTACAAACPTQAIVFGDRNDRNSRVAKLKAEPLNYGMLEELNTRPRTTYLAAVRNPNPEMPGADEAAPKH